MKFYLIRRLFLLLVCLGVGLSCVAPSMAARNRPENTGFIFTYDRPPSIELGTDSENSARQVAVTVINFILFFLGLTGIAVIIFAGFKYVTAGGDDTQRESAKNIITYTAVGIVIIFISFALVNTLLTAANPNSDGDPARVGLDGQTIE